MIKYITQQVINLLGYLFNHYDTLSSLSTSTVTLSSSNTSTDSIAFGIDADSNYGYIKAGAATVVPFKSQTDIDNAYAAGYSASVNNITTKTASYSYGPSGSSNFYFSVSLGLVSGKTMIAAAFSEVNNVVTDYHPNTRGVTIMSFDSNTGVVSCYLSGSGGGNPTVSVNLIGYYL